MEILKSIVKNSGDVKKKTLVYGIQLMVDKYNYSAQEISFKYYFFQLNNLM